MKVYVLISVDPEGFKELENVFLTKKAALRGIKLFVAREEEMAARDFMQQQKDDAEPVESHKWDKTITKDVYPQIKKLFGHTSPWESYAWVEQYEVLEEVLE